MATTGRTGSDSPLSPEMIANGRRLVTKLWNASRFAEGRLGDFANETQPAELLPTDRWLLSRLARTVASATAELASGEYSTARAEVERFFWSDLCDNYLGDPGNSDVSMTYSVNVLAGHNLIVVVNAKIVVWQIRHGSRYSLEI